jgi:hypothetical protein
MRKIFSVLIAIIFAFSITIFANVGQSNTASATSTKASPIASLAPFTQVAIAVNSSAESRRCEQPLLTEFPFLQFENANFETTKTNIFENSTYYLPPKRITVKRSKANIRSPDVEQKV